MKQYDSYKESGVQWIGKIPSHWKMCRLKDYCSLSGRIGWNGLRADEFRDESYAYLVTGQDFTKADIDWSRCYQIDKERYDEDPFIQLRNGDLLITKDGTIGKIAKVSALDKPACLNSGIFVMKQLKNIYKQDFLYWLLVSNLLKDFNSYTSSGTTILHLYQNVFVNMPMLIPSLQDQQAIATYLDKKCAEIDKAIATQQKRIELLQELRQNIITNAVTRGINPDAPLKDSGVQWIGMVPEHWEVRKLKNICKSEKYSIKTGPFGTQLKGQELQPEGDVRVYNQRNVIDNQFIETQFYVSSEKAKELESFYTKPLDLLVTSRGTIGKCSILPLEAPMGILHPCLIAMRIDQRICDIKYTQLYIGESSCFSTNVFLNSNATTIEVIYTETLKSVVIPVPPVKEQQSIVAHVESETARLDKQVAKAERQISLLQELKQSIITEVVTGQRQVC